jgi:hypothetical protein
MLLSGSVAEWSKALVLGTSPQGRGFESHRCQIVLNCAHVTGELSSFFDYNDMICLVLNLQSTGRYCIATRRTGGADIRCIIQ